MPILGGGSGGVPINGLAPFYVPDDTEDGYANVITTASGEVYLKTGVLETNASLYPDAATSDEPVALVGTVDLNILTSGGSSFQDITYDGTNLWALSDGDNKLYKLTTGSSPTYTGTAIAIGAESWRGLAADIANGHLGVLASGGAFRIQTTAGGFVSNGTIANLNYASLAHNGSNYVGLAWENFSYSTRAGTLYNLGAALTQAVYLFDFPQIFARPSALHHDGNKYWSNGAYGIFKHWGGSNYSAPNPLTTGGAGLTIAGNYFYTVDGSNTLTVYSFDTSVVGIPFKLSDSFNNYQVPTYEWGFRATTPAPLYVRVK